jgi:catechol 2,3-dioxygenase-like lactoylglutathione lyase family enzyme
MPQSLVTGLRSVELGVADVPASEKFYTEVWRLDVAARAGGSVYLRGTGGDHHILSLHPRAKTELLTITFTAASRAAVDTLASRLKAAGGAIKAALLDEPGGGYGFAFRDAEGRRFRIVTGDTRHADAKSERARPERLAHVVLNSKDADAAMRFFTETLGFKLSDTTRMMHFIRCNSDHHNIAFHFANDATLNHIAFMMPDWESVMLGAGRLRDAGHPIEWGVGRHGPGNNVFAYFVDPGDVVIEYTAEVEQVDDSYVTGKPEDWKWPPGRIDQWGISNPPTPRLKNAQTRIRFADDTSRN